METEMKIEKEFLYQGSELFDRSGSFVPVTSYRSNRSKSVVAVADQERVNELRPLTAGTIGASLAVISWILLFFITCDTVNGQLGLLGFFGLILTIPCCALFGLTTGWIVNNILVHKDSRS
jgi:hypothetical protein